MSSSDRRSLLIALAALPLAGCGFSPVHGPGGTGEALRGTIEPDAPSDRLSYAFVARFEDRLGRAPAPRWALGYTIQTRQIPIGVSADNVITRFNVTGQLNWSIRPAGGGDPVATGTLDSFTAYSATGTTVATTTARRDAEDRLMTILADLLVTQLYARGLPS
jgi:LPS-assembly lipoprotein